MLRTRLCELLGIEYPVISAGMGAVALARLAAAVSEAGGMGTIGLAALGADAARAEIRAARELTARPFGVNLLIPFIGPGLIDAVIAERPAAATFFWGAPDDFRISKSKCSTDPAGARRCALRACPARST